MESVIKNATDAIKYIHGGRGKITLVSKKTRSRFTYKFNKTKPTKPSQTPLVFASLLTGSDNQGDYRYIGYIKADRVGLHAGKKGQPTAVGYKALDWAMFQLSAGIMPNDLEVWHSGTCGRCGRELTVPTSIASGMGPVCAEKQTNK